jgi:hypothetical protein
MANYFYPEEFQDFPKSKKSNASAINLKPSKMTLKFILGYGAALELLKTKKIGNIKILLN